jgi:hypothetical protein
MVGIVVLLFYSLIAHVSVMIALQRLWCWYAHQPGDQSLRDALIGVASVAVVVWTGALIAFQIRGISVEIGMSLEYLHFAFIAPLFTLIGPGPLIRTAALFLVIYYIRRTFVHFRMVRFFVIATDVHTRGTRLHAKSVQLAQRIFRITGITTLTTLLACFVVFAYPSQIVVAWSSLLTMLAGLQYITTVLTRNTKRPF